jgi:hypothetical protein
MRSINKFTCDIVNLFILVEFLNKRDDERRILNELLECLLSIAYKRESAGGLDEISPEHTLTSSGKR